MIVVKYPFALGSVFLWIGFVCAISFMEAWLKFRAPNVTLSIGLGIGRLVFSALNKMEWIFSIVIICNLFIGKGQLITLNNLFFLVPLLLLIVQTLWLLPALDTRAEMHIQQQIVPSSNLHFYYVGMELIKVISLTIFGVRLFNVSSM